MLLRILSIILIIFFISLDVSLSVADVNWIDFSNYPVGAQSKSGLTSNDGLVLTAEFTNLSGFRSNYPSASQVTIDDPAWPFANKDVLNLFIIGDKNINTSLTMTFTNPGGLPPGGSIAVIDLEFASSAVTITGYFQGTVVPVNWSFSHYELNGLNVDPPEWDADTNTLRGSGESHPTFNNFAFLSSDIRLDAVVLDIAATRSDGIQFGATKSEIVHASVPAASATSLIIAAISMIALAFFRKSKSIKANMLFTEM